MEVISEVCVRDGGRKKSGKSLALFRLLAMLAPMQFILKDMLGVKIFSDSYTVHILEGMQPRQAS